MNKSAANGRRLYPDPGRFAGDIRSFERADRQQPPPEGAIVCTGSSTIRGWHETLQADLAPLTVVPRGFGGSNMNDLLQYVDRIVTPCRQRAVVMYEGDNDVAEGVGPAAIVDVFREIRGKIHGQLPACRLYAVSVKPSIARWNMWPTMQEVNQLLVEECATDERLTYVDVASAMLGEEGEPREDLYADDQLHLSPAGYRLWRDALRPVLMANELAFEST